MRGILTHHPLTGCQFCLRVRPALCLLFPIWDFSKCEFHRWFIIHEALIESFCWCLLLIFFSGSNVTMVESWYYAYKPSIDNNRKLQMYDNVFFWASRESMRDAKNANKNLWTQELHSINTSNLIKAKNKSLFNYIAKSRLLEWKEVSFCAKI